MYEEEIRYYDESAWRKYLTEDLGELYKNIEIFFNLKNELVSYCRDKSVSDLIKDPVWKEILLGGFTGSSEKPFEDNSLANFYKNVFGIGIDDKVGIIITRCQEGLSIETATEDLKPTIIQTPEITKILSDIRTQIKTIYKSLKETIEEPEVPSDVKIEDSMVGINIMKDLLNSAKRLLPLYNRLSFFIYSLFSVPKFYVSEAYEKLFDENVQNILKKYGINIVNIIEPDVPDDKIREERAIVGLEDPSSAGIALYNLIDNIFNIFSGNNLALLSNYFFVEDERKKYIQIASEKCRESINLNAFDLNKFRGAGYEENIGNIEIKIKTSSASIEGGSIRISDYSNTTFGYTEFFAFLAPQMFFGIAQARPSDENRKKFWWRYITWSS